MILYLMLFCWKRLTLHLVVDKVMSAASTMDTKVASAKQPDTKTELASTTKQSDAKTPTVVTNKSQIQQLIRKYVMTYFESGAFSQLMRHKSEASFYEKDMNKFSLRKDMSIKKKVYLPDPHVWIGLKSLWPNGHSKWTRESYQTTPYIRVDRKDGDPSIMPLINQSKFQELTTKEARSQAKSLREQYIMGYFRSIDSKDIDELLALGDVASEIIHFTQ